MESKLTTTNSFFLFTSVSFLRQEETPKPKSKIRFHLKKKFTNPTKSAVSSLGLVEGNSTNTVNTVEDTEDSTNAEKKGLETTFSGDEVSRAVGK